MKDLVTNSMLGSGKLCMRKMFFNHRLRLTTKSKSVPLRRGSGIHAALEAFYRDGETNPRTLGQLALKAYREGLKEATPYMLPTDLDRMQKDEAIVQGLPAGYVEVYADDLDNWEIVACEEKVETLIPCPYNGNVHSRFKYGGVLDLVVRDRSTGEYMLVEHKTTTQLGDLYFQKLEIDPQISGYWLMAGARGWPISKIIYNVCGMPGIRQKKTETRPQFLNRLQEELTTNTEKYFVRYEVTRSPEQLSEFIEGLWYWAEYLDVMWDMPIERWLKSDPYACTAYNRLCEFIGPCANGLDGPHMLNFYVRDTQHPEYEEVEL